MGGNALKNAGTERKNREDYFRISSYVCGALSRLFPQSRALPIIAYASKETFGDADILLESDVLPANWVEQVVAEFSPTETYSNGGVFSFDYEKIQIDLITSPTKEYDFAYVYFAYNDLGNLMGRIAHKAGFKFGHDGLWKMLRDETTRTKYADVLVTADAAEAFAFLGYDYERWKQGFNTLEEVFEFAASTPYMSRSIYLLDNRNHESRIRDQKRPSYNAFLKWIEDKPELDRYQWSRYSGDVVTQERLEQQLFWQNQAIAAFPNYRAACQAALDKHLEHVLAKQKWNGEVVRAVTGLSGKELGLFMEKCRHRHVNFNAWVNTQTPAQVEAFIKEMFCEST